MNGKRCRSAERVLSFEGKYTKREGQGVCFTAATLYWCADREMDRKGSVLRDLQKKKKYHITNVHSKAPGCYTVKNAVAIDVISNDVIRIVM